MKGMISLHFTIHNARQNEFCSGEQDSPAQSAAHAHTAMQSAHNAAYSRMHIHDTKRMIAHGHIMKHIFNTTKCIFVHIHHHQARTRIHINKHIFTHIHSIKHIFNRNFPYSRRFTHIHKPMSIFAITNVTNMRRRAYSRIFKGKIRCLSHESRCNNSRVAGAALILLLTIQQVDTVQ